MSTVKRLVAGAIRCHNCNAVVGIGVSVKPRVIVRKGKVFCNETCYTASKRKRRES